MRVWARVLLKCCGVHFLRIFSQTRGKNFQPRFSFLWPGSTVSVFLCCPVLCGLNEGVGTSLAEVLWGSFVENFQPGQREEFSATLQFPSGLGLLVSVFLC